MIHCSECNATLNNFDTKCWSCDVVLGSRKQRGPKAFCKAVDLFLSFLTVVTVMSLLFTGITATFAICAAGLLVLRLVKNSADEMAKLGSLNAFKVVLSQQKRKWSRNSTPQWQLAIEKSRRG